MIMVAVSEQKAWQLLASMPQAAHRRQSGPDKVTHCFVSTVGHPYRSQFSCSM